ncbi:hypothetical protein [Streptomyces bauhiniae]|uniref:Uncharacterized protein n=1 Tax=Streptomyces bauhiniae TaxID=2340725 RepID=A0A7K3QR88_9ACTN|nr:hypothetical protein [Streptomyces bauhiniae]NEB92419.1 hypothetical protein [Streptomyces bauhiniae]
MSAEQSETTKKIANLQERLHNISALQKHLIEAARDIQEVLLFADHPEVIALNDELDTMYRGQL